MAPSTAVKPVQETLLVPAPEPLALAPAAVDNSPVALLARLAADPNVDTAKLKDLMAFQREILNYNAEQAFNRDFAIMQAEIPTIAERGKTDKTTYATLEDIIQAVRPILHKHGFALSHETDWPTATQVKVIGILTHREGHSRRSVFLSAADNTGSKNAIQALGSAMSYGRRYTSMDLLNITTRLMDDDGERSSKAGAPEPPKGYDKWIADFEKVAEKSGMTGIDAMWATSESAIQQYAAKHDAQRIREIKAKARKAGAK